MCDLQKLEAEAVLEDMSQIVLAQACIMQEERECTLEAWLVQKHCQLPKEMAGEE